MNIGIVTMWFERGAGYVSRHYRDALKRDHNVYIYARAGQYPIGDPVWDDEGVTWGKRSPLPVATPIDRPDFVRWVKERELDVVFFNEQQWWEPLQWCMELGLKTGAYIDYYTEETIPFFACYDFLVCNTRRHYSAFDWHPQAFFVPWGTDLALFKPKSFAPVGQDRVTFFHSCGHSPKRKGTDFVLEAASRMKQPAKLVIHSQVDLEQALPEQQSIIQQLQNAGALKIVVETVTAPGLYHLGDVYVGPSRLEGIGLPLIESQACGLPLITTDYPPMNEFVSPDAGAAARVERLWSRKDGYYWPQCRPEIDHLAGLMDEFAAGFSGIATLKRTARTIAEQQYNWLDRTDTLNQIFATTRQNITTKTEVVARTVKYERTRQGLQYRASLKYPWLYKLYLRLRKQTI